MMSRSSSTSLLKPARIAPPSFMLAGRVIHKGGLDVLQDILEQVDLVSQLRQQRRTAGRSLGP